MTARVGSGDAGGGGGGGQARSVYWKSSSRTTSSSASTSVDTVETQHSATGRWLQYSCAGIGAVEVNGIFLIPEGGLVDPAALAAEALASIGIAAPAIRTSPSRAAASTSRSRPGCGSTAWWQTYRPRRSAGRVTSTVTARPVPDVVDAGRRRRR